ncbi:D-erythronate dehydrogenase [Mesorhizobium escarrei]|uniref:D-erythronate dehydrogenase n=1 Tax=Mesorhizobium escarrei TaxID=666018 RepID=A0ABM9E7B7_9HYPH|nr:D-erythronate dehydrogenase [Mesorhizobium escarrei]CAH2405022.1 D-erythronate dehydrogenase [Mesorhizobium escarrei]
MHVVVTGACGFLGIKLIEAIVAQGHLIGADGRAQPISRIVAADILSKPFGLPADGRISYHSGDIFDSEFVASLFAERPESIFHLAALVSGGAERDFDSGMKANLTGTTNVLEAARRTAVCPRFVFTSSVAAYGGDLPEIVSDEYHLTPESSYGVQKAVGELLVNDYTRKGYIDGRSLRLPIIAVRPEGANTAVSSWASAIIREPLSGVDYACPVAPEDRGFILSPRKVIEGLIVGHEASNDVWGRNRSVMMAGLSCTAGELVDALSRIAGAKVAKRVNWSPDPFVRNIITSWPTRFSLEKARRIGLEADPSVDDIVTQYVKDHACGDHHRGN